jgi:hypothetical protein
MRPAASECVPNLPLPRVELTKLKTYDYKQYHARLLKRLSEDATFRRAALKEGGIVWRLVVEFVDIDKVIDTIPMEGTSVALGGTLVVAKEPAYDDDLTIEDERLACGVYDSGTSQGALYISLSTFVLTHYF